MNISQELVGLRATIHELALQVTRLTQAIEPLVRIQQDQDIIRDRVSALEGFKAAILWLSGLIGLTTIARYALAALRI